MEGPVLRHPRTGDGVVLAVDDPFVGGHDDAANGVLARHLDYIDSRITDGIQVLDQFFQDGSFAKLREVSATYTVPERFLRGFTRASISLAGRDLHTWTNYGGLDPEVNVNNIATSSNTADQALTPPLTRFVATFNLTF